MQSAGVWQRVALVALSVYPAAMILVATAQGPGISVDSISYAAAAESWAANGQLLAYDGSDLSVFPIGLPLLVGSLMALGASLSAAVNAMNAISTALTVLAAYFLGRQVLRSRGWALLAAAGVALSASSVRVGSFLWTESVFSALIAWSLVFVAWALRTRRGDWWIGLVAGALVSAATAYRYVGVVAVPVIALGVGWAATQRRVAKGLLAAGVGSLGLVAVTGRNVILGAAPLGERYPGSVDTQGALLGLVRLWGEYLAPSSTTSLTVVFGAIVFVLLVCGAWLVGISKNSPGVLVAGYVSAYWVAILVSQVGTRLDVATERFGAPVLGPSLILILVAVRALLNLMSRQLSDAMNRDPRFTRLWVSGLAVLAGAAIVGLSMLHAFRFVSEGFQQGLGLDSEGSKSGAIASVAAKLPAGQVVASNDPWQVWWSRTEGPVLDYPPSRSEWPDSRVDRDIQRLVDEVRDQGSVLVVLDPNARSFVPIDDLATRGLDARELASDEGVRVIELRPVA